MNEPRRAERTRKTKETDITLSIVLDGTGKSDIATGIPFMDHMLTLFAKHGLFDLTVKAVGDLEIDEHHTMEDLGLTFGGAIADALGDKAGIRRYGDAILPMDEALVLTALDLSGRAYLVWDLESPAATIKGMDTRLFKEFFRALTAEAGMNLHVKMLAGDETHHVFECVFKSFARALSEAVRRDPRVLGIPSTKGVL